MSELIKIPPTVARSAAGASGTLLAGALESLRSRAAKVLYSGAKEGPGVMAGGVFYPVRTLAADDTAALHQFLQNGMSEDSRLQRFMSPMPKVPESAAAWLADRDGQRRVALAALHPEDPTMLVSLVEYAASSEGPPEVALATADEFQGRGIGTNLLRMLATMSLAAGESAWRGDVLADNEGPLHLMAKVGDVELGTVSSGVRSVIVTLDPKRLYGTTVKY